MSKLRGLLDGPDRRRVLTEGDAIRLDLADVSVDVLELDRAAHAGLASLDAAALRALAARFAGEFLQGLEIARSAPYSAWLVGQRRRMRALHAAVLEHLAAALPPDGDDALACLASWLQLAPFDRRAHERLLDALAERGELRAGDEHLAAACRQFEAEGRDAGPLAHAWRSAKQRHAAPRPETQIELVARPDTTRAAPRRASIAVMPFADTSGPSAAGLGGALAHDVTMRLAKLRSMFVISQGSTSALDARGLGAEEAARALDVDYVASAVGRDTQREGSPIGTERSTLMNEASTMAAASSHPAKPDLAAVKARQQAAWSSGDYAVVGTTLQWVGEQLAEACDLRWDERVLDVAAGNGNATLAAARRGARVTSTDYVASLLDRGAERARAERLDIEFKVADVEALPFADASFDAVLSTFGVMFAPDHTRSAAEMARVCRPGGRIGMANWTPDSLIGRLFKVLGRYMPPPAGVQSPSLWGSEPHLKALFGERAAAIAVTPRQFTFRYRSAAHFVEVFRTWYGPVHKAFGALPPEQAAALERDMIELFEGANRGGAHAFVAPSEYLEVVVARR